MRYLLLLTTTASASLAIGQWTTPDLNTAVRADAATASSMLMTPGPDGSTYSTWFESVEGNYQLRMQRLSADGERLWDDAGLVVSDHPQNSALFRYDLKADHAGNAIVAFQDERTGALDIVAYKIGPDGAFLWGADGIELPTPGSTGLAPVIGVLSNDDVIIAWNADGSPGYIAFAKVTSAGDPVTIPNAGISNTTRVSRPKVIASGAGFILQYVLEGASFLAPGTLYAARFDGDAFPVWEAPKVVSTKTVPGFYFPEPASDGHDGFYLAFNTSNPVNPSMTDVYVQRVRANGTLWSEEGTRADVGGDIQKYTGGKGLAAVSDADGVMVPLQITDVAQSQSGIAVQRLDTAGYVQNGEHAPVLIPLGNTSLNDASATADGLLIVHSSGTFGQTHLAATLTDLSGTALGGAVDVSTVNSNKEDLQLAPIVNDHAVAVWQDDRASGGIYAQRIEAVPTGIRSHALDLGVRLEANPTLSPVLLCGGTLAAGTDILVQDAQGRTVHHRTVSGPASRLGLSAPVLANGLYTITVRNTEGRSVLRWVRE